MDYESLIVRPAPRGYAVQVGRWRFERALNVLECGGEVVRMEPKVADLLHAFVLRPGEVLGRPELFAAVWPGVVVGDEALSQGINKLRRALGDASRDARYLQTVPKRGYRLIAKVTALPARDRDLVPSRPADPSSASVESDGTGAPRRPGWRAWHLARRRASIPVLVAVLGLALLVGRVAFQEGEEADLSALVERASLVTSEQLAVPSVVVRLFGALGTDPTSAAMARAVWMQVVATIAQSSGLRVIAAEALAPSVARPHRLPPLYQVDGTVRQQEGRLAIHLVLSSASSHMVLWSREFDLPLGELAGGNRNAASELLRALAVKLTESERARIERPHTPSGRAFQHFLAGQAAFATRDRQGNLLARDHYRRALAEDPGFARALSGLALTHAADATFGWQGERQVAIARAVSEAQRAMAIDPELPDVHWVLAWVETQRRAHARALHHARRALELNPSYADAYALAATVATYTGRSAQALTLMRAAIRLRARPGFLYHLVLGRAHFFLGDDEQAIASLGVSLRANPAFLESRIYLAAALARMGRLESAAWEAEEIRAQAPGFTARRWIGESLLVDRTDIERLERSLEPLGLDGFGPTLTSPRSAASRPRRSAAAYSRARRAGS